jgi:Flp pilus assembly secretin CpaC
MINFMKKLPRDFLVLTAGIALMLQCGCGGGMSSSVSAETPLSPVLERADGGIVVTHLVTISGRTIRFQGAAPEATGALQFLANEAGLRSGTITLTQAKADAALAALTRATGREAEWTPRITIGAGMPGRFAVARPFRYPVDWKKTTDSADGWLASRVETREVGVAMEVFPQMAVDGSIQLDVTVETTELEGLVNHANPTANTTVLAEFQTSANAPQGTPAPSVNMGPHEAPFVEPLFSTGKMTASFRMRSGQTIVLRGDAKRTFAVPTSLGAPGSRMAATREETLLVFLTATAERVEKN